ncbi:MAG TPA: hypothetical protein VFL83_14085 [Anaeromyxobacter sp.]|nr:hypothetical protein [Anaeromyxobacter sp.]
MRSVADELKREDRARLAALSPGERIALSVRLAEAAIEVLRAARGLSRGDAVALARRVRRSGRRASASASG